jgi:5,10-methylenetetrahydromethanopterin reductase
VKAGLLLLPHDPPARLVEVAKLAEATGYDHFWLADERFFREVYGSLTLVAHHTSRITVGTCVTDPYSRHPALTAMAIATLDESRAGRCPASAPVARASPSSVSSASGRPEAIRETSC